MTSIQPTFRLYALLICLITGTGITVTSCSGNNSQKNKYSATPPDSTWFTEQVEVKYAEGFRLSYHSNYKLLEIINPFQDVTDTLRYVLKPRGVALNEKIANAQVVNVPVRSMIVTSTTHIGLTGMLNSNDVIKGVVGAEYVYNDEVRNRLDQGEVTPFTEGAFNKEQALAMKPDVIMISGGQSSQFGNYKVLMESGINVVVNSEWLETTPLGKAEWVKMLAALLNKEELANEQFKNVAERYEELKSKVGEVGEKPLVLSNMPYKGDWFVPGGNSFTARFLRDAGADYPWFDHQTSGGLRLDFEVVYEVGLKADIWLNPGGAETKEDILAKDARFKAFRAYKTGQIYNSNKRLSPSGGNDFWESAVVYPERVLADLIHIFHPSLLPEHELYYYRKVNSHE